MCTSRGKKKIAGRRRAKKKHTDVRRGKKKIAPSSRGVKKKMVFGENRGGIGEKNYRQVASGKKKTGFIRGGEKKTTPC